MLTVKLLKVMSKVSGGRRGPLIIETGLHGITAALMPLAV